MTPHFSEDKNRRKAHFLEDEITTTLHFFEDTYKVLGLFATANNS